MPKIMLVEDDNNLREIYEARLLAEGYEIISAEDGEQALAMAVKEKPDLIISDIMMPKISGFDMLDILRSTPETKNTKVIMMTALSQAEDKARADKLGADRYLVKSQVTLEDVAKVAREVLQDKDTVPAAAVVDKPDGGAKPAAPAPPPPEPPKPAAPAAPASSTSPSAVDPKLTTPAAAEAAGVKKQIRTFVSNIPVAQPRDASAPAAVQSSADPTSKAADDAAKIAGAVNDLLQKGSTPAAPPADDKPAISHTQISGKKVISPINDLSEKPPSLDELLAKENAKQPADTPPATSVIAPGGTNPAPGLQAGGNPADPNSIAL
jgi:CheY-like chemotaxis protein